MKRRWESQKWPMGEGKRGKSLPEAKGWQEAGRTRRGAWQVGQEGLRRRGQ